jgi:hypothetical protein
MMLIHWVVFGEQTLSRSRVTARLCRFRDSHDCKTTRRGGRLQEHKMSSVWCALKRLFVEPEMVEAFVKKVIILIDGWHIKLSQDSLCLPIHTKNSVRNTVTTGWISAWSNEPDYSDRLLWIMCHLQSPEVNSSPLSGSTVFVHSASHYVQETWCWILRFACGINTVWNELWKQFIQRSDLQGNKHKTCNK